VTPDQSWPKSGIELLARLRGSPGTVGFILNDEAHRCVLHLSELLNEEPCKVGIVVTRDEPPRSVDDLIQILSDHRLFIDIEVLFWQPWLNLDPIGLFHSLSRHSGLPVLAEWPGTINRNEATYSAPGRQDYFRASMTDVVILRPRERLFPDEAPFTLEWM
jgi:hypothetical protein